MGDRMYDSLLNVFEFNEKNNVIILIRILGVFQCSGKGVLYCNRCTSSIQGFTAPHPNHTPKNSGGKFYHSFKMIIYKIGTIGNARMLVSLLSFSKVVLWMVT